MLFGNDKKKENASGIFVGPHGMTTNVSGNVAIVRGSNGHDGMYTRAGNTIVGPHGRLYNIVGSGPSATIVGPHGKLYNVIENGSGATKRSQPFRRSAASPACRHCNHARAARGVHERTDRRSGR